MKHDHNSNTYKKGSITLGGTVAMGTGVMIGAGIFALTGQVAQLAGPLFPLAFVVGAIVTGFSAYSYIKMSNAWPSSGGIAMILQKAYGPGAIAAGAALLMALSMVIAESLVTRTFATYVLRPFRNRRALVERVSVCSNERVRARIRHDRLHRLGRACEPRLQGVHHHHQ